MAEDFKENKGRILGAFMVEKGFIHKEALDTALSMREKDEFLQEVLVRLKLVSEEDIVNFLGREFDMPTVFKLEDSKIDPNIVRLLEEPRAKKSCAIPLFKIEDELIIALSNPLDNTVSESLQLATGLEIIPLISSVSQIKSAIENYYKAVDDIAETKEEAESFDSTVINLDLTMSKDENEFVRIVNLLIKQAVQEKCSDIHIEGQEDGVYIRFRDAGFLKDVKKFPRRYHSNITSRIKIMANLDITEKRKPQDGRIQIRAAYRDLDLRVSCFPTINGEKIVMRLLDKTNVLIKLHQLGFSPRVVKKMEVLVKQSYGMILITGPTGSGKSTTLYAALNSINTREKNIITVEDPVEYKLSGINQAQVDIKAGFSFAVGLRSILRQDPDVIMIGEIRDEETANMAVHAALTGHLVFSTLHTNDAPGAITRLIDMGIEPFMISASLIGVIAQRLIRTLCPSCRKPFRMPDEMKKRFSFENVKKELVLYKGQGCRLCKGTGYKGRSLINELIVVNEKIKTMIQKGCSEYELREQARRDGMLTLQEDGIKKALDGVTSLEEILRVTQTVEI